MAEDISFEGRETPLLPVTRGSPSSDGSGKELFVKDYFVFFIIDRYKRRISPKAYYHQDDILLDLWIYDGINALYDIFTNFNSLIVNTALSATVPAPRSLIHISFEVRF